MLSSSTKASSRLAVGPIDIARLRGVLLVVACMLVIFASMHWVLTLALGADAHVVYPRQRPLGWAMYERCWRRVAALDHMAKNGQLPPDTRLGVFMGVSTTATGIKREVLDERATLADRWIVLTSAGLSFENLESVMYPIFFCSRRPSVVVIGGHPQMLVGERYFADQHDPQKQVVGRRNRALDAQLAQLPLLDWLKKHWIIRNRAISAEFIRTQFYGLRLWTFYLVGVTADSMFAPIAEPWDDDPLFLWNMDDAQNQFANGQIEFWTRQGNLTAENYDPNCDGAHSLVRMIRGYRALGAKVYVALMPERSTLRERVPANARPCLMEVLQSAFPEAPPEVIDLQDAMADKYFTDEAHLSEFGAEKLSQLVASHLQADEATSSAPAGP